MMNRTALNLDTAEQICGGKKVTPEEYRKELKGNKEAMEVFNMAEQVHNLLNDLGIKHDYTLEIK